MTQEYIPALPGTTSPLFSEEKEVRSIAERFETPEETKALDKQVGGDHYKKFKIQPIEFCQINKLDACQSNVIKYVCRHEFKNGLQDLEKAKHYIDLLIQMEYSNESLSSR